MQVKVRLWLTEMGFWKHLVSDWNSLIDSGHDNEAIILIQMSLGLFTQGTINNNSSLVQVICWRQIGNKSLPAPVMTHFIDAYMLSLKSK